MSLNKILLIGNVGQDPLVRTAGENKVANFNLATTEKRRDRDGNVVAETEWHNVVIWGKLAEVVERYVTKGTQLYIEGRIKTEKYTDKEGNERMAVKVYASALQLLGSKTDGQQAPQAQPNTMQSAPAAIYDSPTDDLPF